MAQVVAISRETVSRAYENTCCARLRAEPDRSLQITLEVLYQARERTLTRKND